MEELNALSLKEIAPHYNELVKMALRTWVTLAILSVYSIGAILITSPCDNGIKLPFVEIQLERNWFSLIALGFITALLTHWVELINRATSLRKNIVQTRLNKESSEDGEPSPTDLWDALVVPGSAAIWSAPASLVREKPWIRKLSSPYLIILKLASAIVHYLLPGCALVIISFALYSDIGKFPIWPLGSILVSIIFIFVLIVAVLQLYQALTVEYHYFKLAHQHLKDEIDKMDKIANTDVPNK